MCIDKTNEILLFLLELTLEYDKHKEISSDSKYKFRAYKREMKLIDYYFDVCIIPINEYLFKIYHHHHIMYEKILNVNDITEKIRKIKINNLI